MSGGREAERKVESRVERVLLELKDAAGMLGHVLISA
jgi:hypothetical protein